MTTLDRRLTDETTRRVARSVPRSSPAGLAGTARRPRPSHLSPAVATVQPVHTPDPVADLSGRWRAHRVDDELRRAAIEVSFDDGDWPELDVPGRGAARRRSPTATDRCCIAAASMPLARQTAGAMGRARRALLSSRRLARRCVSRRSGGLLLRPSLRHHRANRHRRIGGHHGENGGRRARAGGGGHLRAGARHHRPAQHHRSVPALRGRPDVVEPRRPVGSGAPRRHRPGGDRALPRALPRRRCTSRAPAPRRPPRHRRRPPRGRAHTCRRRTARRRRARSRRWEQRARLEPRRARAPAVVATRARRTGTQRGDRGGGHRRRGERQHHPTHRVPAGVAQRLEVLDQRRATVSQGRQPHPDPPRAGRHRAGTRCCRHPARVEASLDCVRLQGHVGARRRPTPRPTKPGS